MWLCHFLDHREEGGFGRPTFEHPALKQASTQSSSAHRHPRSIGRRRAVVAAAPDQACDCSNASRLRRRRIPISTIAPITGTASIVISASFQPAAFAIGFSR